MSDFIHVRRTLVFEPEKSHVYDGGPYSSRGEGEETWGCFRTPPTSTGILAKMWLSEKKNVVFPVIRPCVSKPRRVKLFSGCCLSENSPSFHDP